VREHRNNPHGPLAETRQDWYQKGLKFLQGWVGDNGKVTIQDLYGKPSRYAEGKPDAIKVVVHNTDAVLDASSEAQCFGPTIKRQSTVAYNLPTLIVDADWYCDLDTLGTLAKKGVLIITKDFRVETELEERFVDMEKKWAYSRALSGATYFHPIHGWQDEGWFLGGGHVNSYSVVGADEESGYRAIAIWAQAEGHTKGQELRSDAGRDVPTASVLLDAERGFYFSKRGEDIVSIKIGQVTKLSRFVDEGRITRNANSIVMSECSDQQLNLAAEAVEEYHHQHEKRVWWCKLRWVKRWFWTFWLYIDYCFRGVSADPTHGMYMDDIPTDRRPGARVRDSQRRGREEAGGADHPTLGDGAGVISHHRGGDRPNQRPGVDSTEGRPEDAGTTDLFRVALLAALAARTVGEQVPDAPIVRPGAEPQPSDGASDSGSSVRVSWNDVRPGAAGQDGDRRGPEEGGGDGGNSAAGSQGTKKPRAQGGFQGSARDRRRTDGGRGSSVRRGGASLRGRGRGRGGGMDAVPPVAIQPPAPWFVHGPTPPPYQWYTPPGMAPPLASPMAGQVSARS